MRAGHSICGREGYRIACDAAVKIWARWPDEHMRKSFTTSPRYIYRLVRNLFLDDLRLSHSQHERTAGLPGGSEDGIWEDGAGADPGWEVRHAINLLDQEKAELIFLLYWLRMKLSEASRHMGVTRSKAERLHNSAISELRCLLREEA
ncbi:RNA polymerase sigma factor [Micromonospora sp. NPDC003241]